MGAYSVQSFANGQACPEKLRRSLDRDPNHQFASLGRRSSAKRKLSGMKRNAPAVTLRRCTSRPILQRIRRLSCACFALATTACVTPADGDLAVGPIPLTPSEAATTVARLTRDGCGATWSLVAGDLAKTDVYAVSVYFEAGRSQEFNHFPSPGELERFIMGNRDMLADGRNSLGTYCEHDHGDCKQGGGALNCYIDISRTVKDLRSAAVLATACNQKAIAFLGKDGVKIIDSFEGKVFGNGMPLDDARDLAAAGACRSARDPQAAKL